VLAGRLSKRKVAVAGHSGGTASVLANAGATQRWGGGPVYQETSSWPIAFLAASPQGPMDASFNSGFGVSSFDDVDRPFMFITGAGDETGEPPAARTTAWFQSQPGSKFLSWDRRPAALHETMDIERCETPLRERHCEWIASAGTAFLDAIVRTRSLARHWMRSNAYEILSGGDIELHVR
jgi:hypothetical protein